MQWRFCPHCGEELSAGPAHSTTPRRETPASPANRYDQTIHWRNLLKRAESLVEPPPTEALVERLLAAPLPSSSDLPHASIVHVVMDRDVTPSGGVLLQSVLSEGRQGPLADLERLRRLGYVLEDGRVKQVEGVPVGRAFSALQYWGGERHHKRWHLSQPVYVNPSRHGDPFFMDDRQIAFGAVWRDLGRLREALTALIDTLRTGFDGASVGNVLVLDVSWRDAPPPRE